MIVEARKPLANEFPVQLTLYFNPRQLAQSKRTYGEAELKVLVSTLVAEQLQMGREQLEEVILSYVTDQQKYIDATAT